jgi:cytochrome P450
MAVRFQPLDPEFLRDPYPTYARLRAESPVHRIRFNALMIAKLVFRAMRAQMQQSDQGIGATLRSMNRQRKQRPQGMSNRFYAVSRHADVVHVLQHAELFSSSPMGGPPPDSMEEADLAPTSGSLIGVDPPEHRQHRGIVNRGFTPRRIAALEPHIRQSANELVSRFEEQGECELMEAFANPLPVGAIVELLGLDPARLDDFKRWSSAAIVGSTQGAGAPQFELMREFRGFMSDAVDKRRHDPSDDLISLLVHAGEDEGVLTTGQVVGFAGLLLAAGSETTTNLIGNAMVALRANPETLARVKADPALIPRVVEESLRLDPPVQLLMRLATQDTEVAGETIPARSMVMPLLGSANRDESVFPDPERFDIDRDTTGHLGFGWGNHFCLGSALARLEGRIALETLLERIPDYEIAAPVEPHGSFLIRGPSALHLKFSASTRS